MEIPELVLLETVHRSISLYLNAIRLLFQLDTRLEENQTSLIDPQISCFILNHTAEITCKQIYCERVSIIEISTVNC
jgi:hypothetical protein